MSSPASTNPFGEYLNKKLLAEATKKAQWTKKIEAAYRGLTRASDSGQYVEACMGLVSSIDSSLAEIRGKMPSSVEFGTFRGYLLEEITLHAARIAIGSSGIEGLESVKLSTGDGFMIGANLKFGRKRIPARVEMALRRDREDVVIGFRRDVYIKGDEKTEAVFSAQIIPICAVACKVYIDATRLENVLAKARGMYTQYPGCQFLVLAEWDALGSEWHGSKPRSVLESLISPVSEMLFLRGDEAKRPQNKKLAEYSKQHPIRREKVERLLTSVESALLHWKGVRLK
jgi:hypothetical protein